MDSIGAADHKVKTVARIMVGAFVILAAGIACAQVAAPEPQSPSVPRCLQGTEIAEVAAVTPELNLKLADGRTLLLAGIAVWQDAEAPNESSARQTLAAWTVGKLAEIQPLAGEPDRWGRVPALATVPLPGQSDDEGASLAEVMLGAGLARARPDPRLGGCWPRFLAQERAARNARLGLWAEPRYAVIAADDRARLGANTGALAIVEGRIARVAESRSRTYLVLGNHGRDSFALTIQKPLLARWRAAGNDPTSWRGRDVRVRGFLDDRFGMQIELTSVDQIEFTAPR